MARILVIDDSRLACAALRQVHRERRPRSGDGELGSEGPRGRGRARSPTASTTGHSDAGMDGRRLDALRAKGLGLPVIVVTADIQETTRADCLRPRGLRSSSRSRSKVRKCLRAIEGALAAGPRVRREALTSNQLDALAEFINVGVGRAASALNDLISSHVG